MKCWHAVILYPSDFVWKGAGHACAVLDWMANDAPVFSSLSKAEALQAQRQWSRRGRMSEHVELPYDPRRISLVREFAPDNDAQVKALRMVVEA